MSSIGPIGAQMSYPVQAVQQKPPSPPPAPPPQSTAKTDSDGDHDGSKPGKLDITA